ncbi:MAG: ribulokinase, partial [Desulfobacterales bacterium]|nr:ribulokinase [Desulfobacterales bacterium]
VNPKIREAAASWAEHCDWMTAVLTGQTAQLKRSRCAAGHKAMWHKDFGGLPPKAFWEQVDPLLAPVCDQLFSRTLTADTPAGTLAPEWAEKLGLSTDVIIATGVIDAHAGAVGGQIRPGALLKVMGTSTCDMITASETEVGNRLIQGICGQVNGSILPDMVGMEAGQSAFGDLYAWFRDLLLWPVKTLITEENNTGLKLDKAQVQALADQIIPALADAAAKLSPRETAPVALDWMNGRRTPDADQNLQGAMAGLTLGTTPPALFRTLVEATAFGSRRIAERFQEEGVNIESVIAVGGVAKKSPLVMQIVADVMDMEIQVARSEQTCALGAAMLAATAAGLYPDLATAQEAMGQGFETTYAPAPEMTAVYNYLYQRYLALGAFVEATTE